MFTSDSVADTGLHPHALVSLFAVLLLLLLRGVPPFIYCTVTVEMLKHGLALNRIFPKLRTKKESYSFVRTERPVGTGIVRSIRLSAMKLLFRRNW